MKKTKTREMDSKPNYRNLTCGNYAKPAEKQNQVIFILKKYDFNSLSEIYRPCVKENDCCQIASLSDNASHSDRPITSLYTAKS